MAKLTFRKIAVAALSAVGLSALSFGAAGCLPKSTDMTEPDNIEISRTAPPEDGSLPTAHTCAENLAYIIYVFDNQPQYHTYSYGVTGASIATQTTRNFRDYKNGILLNTDLTYSSMVKGGTQTCSMYNEEGEYEVYFRTSEAPEADTLPSQAVWSEEAPTFFNERSYHFTYGLLPNELFNYIVNEENVIDSEQIKVNSDGTYTQNFTLDPVASTYYYQFGMKTRGGLSGYPDFESITFSVTFDKDWQILSAKMHEVAKVNKGIVVTSVSDFNTQYWYGDDHFDEEHYSYYENYFKKYLGDDNLEQGGSQEEGLTIDVTNVLSNGFSQIMNGGAQFEVALNIGANRYVGYAFVSLDLADPLGTLALKVSLGKSLREQTLYLEYGDGDLSAYYGKDFALGANLAEVKLAVGEFGEIIDKIKAAFTLPEETDPDEGETAETAEGSDPLTALMDSMELVADDRQAVLTLNTDDLLGLGIGINAKLVFGINNNKITFRSASVGNLSIGGERVDMGVSLQTTTAPEINRVPSETGADLAEYIADVHSLLGADLIKATVTLNGDGEKVSIGALKGLNANITAYADLDGVTVGADAEVSYTYLGHTVSAKAHVWYGYDAAEKNYGKAIISLTELNGAPVNMAVKCDIKEVADALGKMITFSSGGNGGATDGLVSVINGALSSDFSALLTELYADKAQIKVGLSVDALLDMLSAKTGIKFGSCTLKYARGGEDSVYGGELSAKLPALGLSVSICGESGAIAQPDEADCLDLTDLVNTVQAAWEQVEGIIDGQRLTFEIIKGETFLSLDGIIVEIWGDGEISWQRGGEYVALDLSMAITERATDVLTLKFIYDKNAEEEPLVKLALNGVGIEIYKEDIETTKSGFNDIYNKVKALLGTDGEETQPTEPANGVQNAVGTLTANDNLTGVLFGLLASNDWVDELNNLTLTSDGKSVALSYLAQNAVNVRVSADGNLSLYYDGAFGERFSLGGGLVAYATVGDLRDVINAKLEDCKMSSTKTDGSAGFVKLAYDYLFEAISAIDVKNILGSDTYTVTFKLNGANTNIGALENVYVGAEIYFTGANGAQPKLAEANLNIDAAGVVIKLNVITERHGDNTHFYINLSQVADIKLPDLKFKASQQSLYETFDVLISAVNDTNILNSVAKLIGSSESEEPTEGESEKPVITDETADTLADLITKLLHFDLNDAVAATEVEGITTATIDLDNVVKQLGFKTGALGTVEAVINHHNHSMKTSGKTLVTDFNGNTELKEWISLSSELAARRDYSKIDRSEYISIEFLPTLIDDALKFATDENGDLHDSFTLSGSIKANLVGMIDVNIDPCTLTVNIGENGLSLSLVMHVSKAKVIGIGIPESTVGITYRNGLLTLAKGLNTSTPEYKVMTFDYFLDHMLTKKDSVLNWLLDISGWDLIMSFVKTDVSSGLTSPEDISLFDAAAGKDEKEISMYDFVDALSVVIGGNQTAVFGNYGALESDLGVSDNYYGFALNAGAVTNGVLTKLNAAITRGDNGLDRVLASGQVQSYVSFSANLQYKETWTQEYELGTTLQGEKTAPDLYERVLSKAAEKNYVPDFDYFVKRPDKGYDEKFGCMSITASGGDYAVTTEYSNILYSHTLTIVKANGEREERLVRHGSTIHLYDNNSPVYTDAGKTVRVLYSTSQDGVDGTEAVMNGDLTVYEVRRAAVTVVVHNGSEEAIVNSFEGDRVPTSVTGLETIGKPTYENGTEVGENDIIDGSVSVIHIYGTFVKSETVVNFVRYTFSAQTMSYTASGKVAGFNDYYSTKGNTLVLENEIGGYPVTAIADNAFANTEGKPIKNVIIPDNVTYIGAGAFLDNVGMESAVILGDYVKVGGNSAKDNNSANDQPFYGCSTEADGTSTKLVIYYNTIECGGSTTNTIWTKFRVSGGAIKNRYYVGQKPSNENGYAKNGGALYNGNWQYVDYAVNVDTNGVSGGTLGEEAVKNILAPYFPYATAGSYVGSITEANVNAAMENGIANFTVLRGGITYACVYTVEVSVDGNRTTVTFNVSYKATAEIYVYSPYAITCYGVAVNANTYTEMTVPVDGETPVMPAPTEATHIFVRWDISESNGKKVYTAVWRDKATYTITVKLNYKAGNQSMLHVGDKTAKAGLFGGASTTMTLYEGTATFTLANNVLTVYDGVNTIEIYANEVSGTGKESSNKRSINSDVTGERTIDRVFTITLSY